MAFFTCPDFDERQFKQLTGATITLSGETNFSGTLKSKGIEIDATTGGTSDDGYVLTFSSGTSKITLTPVSGGTGGGDLNNAFDGERAITRITSPPSAAGDLGTTGITEFLEEYFFPPEPPIPDLNVNGPSREFGDDEDTANGNDYLTWSADVKTHPITGITVNGQFSGGTAVDTGSTTSYSVSSSNYSPTPTGVSTQKSEIYSMTLADGVFTDQTDNVIITWNHKRYWFSGSTKYVSGDDLLIQDILTGNTSSELDGNRNKEFNTYLFSGTYFYYAYPIQFGIPLFTINGILNNAWGDSPSTLFEFDYTNSEGYTERFYLASSDNKLNSTFSIKVT